MKFMCKRYIGDKTIYYAENYISIDTETSNNHNEETPVCWINTIQVKFLNHEYIFRKPSELMEWLNWVVKEYRLNHFYRMLIVIHNLSYDISYLLPFFQFYLPDKEDNDIINDRHKVKAYRQGGLDFRDTYILTQKSLETWGKDFNVEHKKKVGLYDYSKVIYQDTEINTQELTYDLHDVLCLHECFEKQLQLESDNCASIPYTSTGYIRRMFRRKATADRYYMQMFRNSALNVHEYEVTVSSYSGGFTHNNRFYKDKTIKHLIGHRDFRSHYPTQMRNYPLPFGKPTIFYNPVKNPFDRKEKWSVQRILDCYLEYSTITTLLIKKAQLKDKKITMPFMQFSKMRHMGVHKEILDNGRVLSYNGKALLYCGNHTLKILTEQYDIQGEILEVIGFKNSYMPKCLADTIDFYFKKKTDEKIKLKEIEKEYGELSNEAFTQGAILLHMKGGLNGTYGMFVQNPIHEEYNIDFTRDLTEEELKDIYNPIISTESTEDKLRKFYNSRSSFLPYQVGCFVTELAKYELYEYITAIGYEKVLYCDTDSIFYLKDNETERAIEKLNKIKHDLAVKNKAYITDVKGKRIYYDVFEEETDGIAFRGLHSKCYGMIYEEKGEEKLKATIAGIPARTLIQADEGKLVYLLREEELAGITKEEKLKNPVIKINPWQAIENIKDEFTFKVNTGTCAKYIVQKPHIEVINGHAVETAGGCIIKHLEEKQISSCNIDDFVFEEMEVNIE